MKLPMQSTAFGRWSLLYAVLAAVALQVADSPLRAQVVQLPSVRSFGYSGAVSVPDQGTEYLAGNSASRSSSSVSGVGPLAGRSVAGQAGAGSVSVSATVIDLQAMDEALLNQPAGTTSGTAGNYAVRSTGVPVINTLTPHLFGQRAGRADARTDDPNAWAIALGAPGTSQIGLASSRVRDESEVRFYMLKAQEATIAGRNAAARVYYRMAYEKLTPDQRARLHEVQRRVDEEAKQAKQAVDGKMAASPTATAVPAPTAVPAAR